MVSISLPARIASAAAYFSEAPGAVALEARRRGLTRQAVHGQAVRFVAVVESELRPGPSRAELLREVGELRRENRELRARLKTVVEFPEPRRREFAVHAVAMGSSLNQIVDLLALVLGDAAPGRSTVHRWVDAAADAAGAALKRLDAGCRGLVTTACLDEIYFNGRPVLVGVEPKSMTAVLTKRVRRLTRRAWLAALRPLKSLEYAVSDAGTVLRSALTRVAAVRHRARAPALEAGLDVFHAAKEARRVLKILWNRVRKDWKGAEAADAKVAKTKRRGERAGKPAAAARAAWNAVARSMTRHDAARDGWRHAKAALEVLRPDGRLNDRTRAETRIAEALPMLADDAFTTLRGLLGKPDALTFLDRLHRRLDNLGLDPDLLEVLVRLWRLNRLRDDDEGRNTKACVVQRAVCWKLAPDGWAENYDRVAAILQDPGRASSLVECVNSVLRMHQSRHRSLNQKLLDLKRLYWNTRKLRDGRRRGRCPYELLGLKLPSYDLWTILQSQAATPC